MEVELQVAIESLLQIQCRRKLFDLDLCGACNRFDVRKKSRLMMIQRTSRLSAAEKLLVLHTPP